MRNAHLWVDGVTRSIERMLPEGTVFILALGTVDQSLPDGRRPVDFEVLTNADPEYAKLVMRKLGEE